MLIIGIGHPFRRDDGAGPTAAALLAALGFDTLSHHGEGTDLMERWQGHDDVVLIDATASGAAPGTVRLWQADQAPLPSGLFPKSSHTFGVAEAVEMARLLGRLPERMRVIGIEGADFSSGQDLSPAVAEGVAQAVRLCQEWTTSFP